MVYKILLLMVVHLHYYFHQNRNKYFSIVNNVLFRGLSFLCLNYNLRFRLHLHLTYYLNSHLSVLLLNNVFLHRKHLHYGKILFLLLLRLHQNSKNPLLNFHLNQKSNHRPNNCH